MSLKIEMGKIRIRLLKLGWINPSATTTVLLNTIIKRHTVEKFAEAIDFLIKEGHMPDENPTDISSRITILYLGNVCKKLDIIPEEKNQSKLVLKDIVKDVLDD